jgi:hypothetical protein
MRTAGEAFSRSWPGSATDVQGLPGDVAGGGVVRNSASRASSAATDGGVLLSPS